jgi:hypothetical protein
VTSCFVAVTPDNAIAGYYTLASGSIPIAELLFLPLATAASILDRSGP